jgi:AraC-like DNA-binding protein
MLSIRSLAATYYDGYHIEPHAHPWGQLIYASEGVMKVRAGEQFWIVPPQRAVWAPPKTMHEIWTSGTFAMRTLYIAPQLSVLLSPECKALDISPLLRELVLHIVRVGMLDSSTLAHGNLINVLLDQLVDAQSLILSLRLPTEKRARAVADRLQLMPSDDASIDSLAREAGASTRTLQRLFLAETGLRFSEWRQRLRLLHAVALLNSGVSVTEAGFDAGYNSTSAFIAAFRKQIGETPRRYCATRRDEVLSE